MLTGASSFEVAEPDAGGGWKPVGPNSLGGELDVGPGPAPHTYSLDPNHPVVWVSEDAAASWRARRVTTVTDGVPAELVPDPGRPGVLYLALTSTASEPTFQGQVLRSDDDGRTWTTLPAPDVDMRDLEVAGGRARRRDGRGLYAGTRGGADWEPVKGPWRNVAATQLVGADLYAATDAGCSSSTASPPGVARRAASTRPAARATTWSPATRGLLVASTGFDVRGSTDGGRTWSKLFTPPQGGRIWSLSVVGRAAYVGTFAGVLGRRS